MPESEDGGLMPYLLVTVKQDDDFLFSEYIYVPESEEFMMVDNALFEAKRKNMKTT